MMIDSGFGLVWRNPRPLRADDIAGCHGSPEGRACSVAGFFLAMRGSATSGNLNVRRQFCCWLVALVAGAGLGLLAEAAHCCQESSRQWTERDIASFYGMYLDQFSAVSTFEAQCEIARKIDGRWRPVSTIRVYERGRCIRCELEGLNASGITIVHPLDVAVPCVAWLHLGRGEDRKKNAPVFVAGDRVLEDYGWTIATCAVDLAMQLTDPTYHRISFPLDVSPIQQRRDYFLSRRAREGRLEISDTEFHGVACKLVTFYPGDHPEQIVRSCLDPVALRIAWVSTEFANRRWRSEVLEWIEEPVAGKRISFPKIVESCWLENGQRSEEERYTLSDVRINQQIEDHCFRLSSLEGLKPGQSVTWIDTRPYPCELTQKLIWDGEKLVCGELGGPVAEIAPVRRTSLLRRLAQWCIGLGAAGVALVLFRSIRRKRGARTES